MYIYIYILYILYIYVYSFLNNLYKENLVFKLSIPNIHVWSFVFVMIYVAIKSSIHVLQV